MQLKTYDLLEKMKFFDKRFEGDDTEKWREFRMWIEDEHTHPKPIAPMGEVVRSVTPKKGVAVFSEPQIELQAWCPDEHAQEPPEQVHFYINYPAPIDAPPILIRFKGPTTLGFWIEELARFRRFVWPDSQVVNLSGD